MVIQATKTLDVNLDPSVQDIEGFAYVSNCKPQHPHSKKPKHGDLNPRSIAFFSWNICAHYFNVTPN
ncbi:uncharacterized protein PGTG_17278 [Puccinia graminis f. sp. tritici CRL 75-36-700-3]|uniref:Uncharacterized protein n=1 Tax=Puccinia graminis f. sp. tritici (strain CRL 75-36-700-3 / race SCCL) TaxID=418459 RepID=E3L381_PUCGT|nr:uncharacterized protein PGTG_17278 [Puccinia graminis f. sp. tritici CRL 75-36-700-3]EFP91006.2 hypothetical protein PGTG_17278 [Puccinia graminis f. sp. tritici CRL 75-36-700-3]